MGYCRRCGDLVYGDRCSCGGAKRESTSKPLFNTNSMSDRWTAKYTTSPSSASTSQRNEHAITSTPTILRPLPRTRHPSGLTEDGSELSGVFGSVLSPNDIFNCVTCKKRFKENETLYPHPDVKIDSRLKEVFFCRACFAESFSKGNCQKCKCAVLSDAPFTIHGSNLWHDDCYVCSYCVVPSSSIVIDFAGVPSCEACFDSLAYTSSNKIPISPIHPRTQPRQSTLRPAPSKWGGPVTPPPLDRSSKLSGLTLATEVDTNVIGWRARRERDKSPMASTYNELGAKLRQVGLDQNNSTPARRVDSKKEEARFEEKKLEAKPEPLLTRNVLASLNTSIITPRTRTQSDNTRMGSGILQRAANFLSPPPSPIKDSFESPRLIKRSTWTTSTTPLRDLNPNPTNPVQPLLTVLPQSTSTPNRRQKVEPMPPSVSTDQPAWFTPKLRPVHSRTQSLPPSPISVPTPRVFTATSSYIFPSSMTNSRPTSPLKSTWSDEQYKKEDSSIIKPSVPTSPTKRGPLPIFPTLSSTSTTLTSNTPSWLKPRSQPHSRSQSLPPPPMIDLPGRTKPSSTSISSNASSQVKPEETRTRSPVRTQPSLPRAPLNPLTAHPALKPDLKLDPRNTPTSLVPELLDDQHCPICKEELGYGDFIQLAHTKEVIHKECFKCGGCREVLNAGKHVEIEGKAWHQKCAPPPQQYRALVSSIGEDSLADSTSSNLPPTPEKCDRCSKSLGTQYSVSVARTGKSYHQDCFTCSACKQAFGQSGDDRSFVEVEGVPYHPSCVPKTLSTPSRSLNPSPFRTTTSSRSPASSPIPRPAKIEIPESFSSSLPLRSSPSSIFSRERPTNFKLGGLIICAGCSLRGTEKETVVGPKGRRYHAKCLRCSSCRKGLDSECRVGEAGELRCEACRIRG